MEKALNYRLLPHIRKTLVSERIKHTWILVATRKSKHLANKYLMHYLTPKSSKTAYKAARVQNSSICPAAAVSN